TAVVTIIMILVSLLCAALNHTKAKALRISCINNLKHLQGAWLLYVQDNESYFPLNQTAPAPVAHHRIPISLRSAEGSWVSDCPLRRPARAPVAYDRVSTSLRGAEGSGVPGSPLLDLTTANIKRRTLFEYVSSTDTYRCPMDSSTVYKHPDVLRTRSYAMSAY